MRKMTVITALLSAMSLVLTPVPTSAQDTLRLADLQRAARSHDPRSAQFQLLEQQNSLRLENLRADKLPQFTISGEVAHQSDVTTFTTGAPGARPPVPPKDRWQTLLNLQHTAYDGGAFSLRRDLELARLAEQKAAVAVAQYRLTSEVEAAFFGAFMLQERRAELNALTQDLEARLDVTRTRLREGAALPGDTAAIRAELLRTAQAAAEVVASRTAALRVLEILTGVAVRDAGALALPDFALEVAQNRGSSPRMLRGRPEFEQFATTRSRIQREELLTRADLRPRVSIFGQGGVGRPGFNQFSGQVDEIWQAGVRMEWRFFNWGNSRRQREALRVQQRIVETEEAALAESIDRSIQADVAEMDRLQSAIQSDAQIIQLREQVEAQARMQLDGGEITAPEYVVLRTDVLEARLALQRHRAELAQAQARYLTSIGAMRR